MISFQEYRPQPETREGEGYTEQRVAAAVARANGETPAGVAAVEAAVGMWERAFASARSETLTAAQLALIDGRCYSAVSPSGTLAAAEDGSHRRRIL